MNEIMRYSIALEWGEGRRDVSWAEAMSWCKGLGDGWRAPTDIELLLADVLGVQGFELELYWSSADYYEIGAWCLSFLNGQKYSIAKERRLRIRAVREVQG